LTNLTYEEDFPEIIAGFNKVVPDELSNLDEFNSQCGVAFNIESEKLKKPEAIDDGSYANLSFFDPRGVKFGLRMVCAPNGFIYKGTIKKVPEEEYNKVCSLNGISSSQAMVSKLPFMFNSDIYNGFSFSKGCYLGQEIVARAYFTGIVRRRIFPF
jgi:folate-binding protein YgfZ